ncbi:hypothetical protein JCM11491_001397 [Sporobolomyces phaffii]
MAAQTIETLQQVATFVAQYSALFPGLLAFSIGSRSSLKSWLAVQQAPPAPRLDKDVEKKMKRKMRAVAFVVLTAILGLEFYLFAQGNEATIDRFFVYLFGYVFQVSLVGLFVEITQATQWSAHRGAAGILHFRPVNLSKPRMFVAFTAATALNVAAYYGVHWTCGSVLAVAVLTSRVSATPGRTFSIRSCIFVLLGILAFLTILSGVAVTAALKTDKASNNGGGERSDSDEIEYVGFASPHVMRYINPFMISIYTMLQGVLIAGCFRFDHANSVEASPETFAPVALESVEAPACKIGLLSSGVVVPFRVSEHFSRPYYSVALWSWLLAQLSTAALFVLALPFPRAVLDSGAYSLLGFALSSLFLVVGVTLTSVLRGEAKKMWTYKEVWIPKADKGVVLEDNVPVEQDADEVLPAYQAPAVPNVDVKQQAVAYEVSDAKV